MNKSDRERDYLERFEVDLGLAVLDTPAYFPAITGRHQLFPMEMLIKAITSAGCNTMMVSAYDIYYAKNKKGLLSLLKEFSRKGFLFLDSGGFEAQNDAGWDFAKYQEIVKEIPAAIYSSFDMVRDNYSVNIHEQIIEYMSKSLEIAPDSTCAIVCHGRTPDHLVEVAASAARRHPGRRAVIAVPIRECGTDRDGQLYTIEKIRSRIDRSGRRAVLHILGCDDPLSAIFLVCAGADTVDGTAWYKRMIGESVCRSFCPTGQEMYAGRHISFGSNISFYTDKLRQLRDRMMVENDLEPAGIGPDVSDRLQSRLHLDSGAA